MFCRPIILPIPSAALFLGLRVRIPPGAWMSVVKFVFCQLEVSASDSSLVQGSPTECGVSGCDREASTMRRPWPTRAVAPWKKKKKTYYIVCLFVLLELLR
jgi:hypothetical protein